MGEVCACCMQGKSGISAIENFDTSEYSTQFAGEIKDINLDGYVDKKNARRLDTTIKYIMVSGKQVPPSCHTPMNPCSCAIHSD